jgi:predicted transcriptional regulator
LLAKDYQIMTEALFQDLLKRQKESGLTVRDFCGNEGIVPSTFYYWLKKSKLKETRPKVFIPLTIVGEQLVTHKKNRHFLAHPSAKEMDTPVLLELVFPNGTVLKVRSQVDLPLLQKLIHLYD